MSYFVQSIPTDPNGDCIPYVSEPYSTYIGALFHHIKINYQWMTSAEIDEGDMYIHLKIFAKSLIGKKTNWSDVSLAGENSGTQIIRK